MSSNIEKLYFAFKSGFCGSNFLENYYYFFIGIIIEEKVDIIIDNDIAKKFNTKYGIQLPLTFVRQVLSFGIANNTITEVKGQYISDRGKMEALIKNDNNFDVLWQELINAFKNFVKSKTINLDGIDIENSIFEYLDDNDEKIIVSDFTNIGDDAKNIDSSLNYAWGSFVKEISTDNVKLFNFIVAICSGNIIKQAAFFAGDARDSFKGLNVYLDAPMVFSLLGMDSEERVESIKMLVLDMKEADCNVCIFEHSLNEASAIICNASAWANSPHYDISKANNVARFLHDKMSDSSETAEFCENIEDNLKKLGITIAPTAYEAETNPYQESEDKLLQMLIEKYQENGCFISDEKKHSLMIDVRSILWSTEKDVVKFQPKFNLPGI